MKTGTMLITCLLCGYAQTAPASFEVASIRVNTSGAPKPSIETAPGRIQWANVTLQYCIKTAYGVNDYQISGPAWITSEHYDIQATTSAPVTNVQRNQMLQALLAERFKLAVHKENKPGRVLALVVAAGGPKFKESKADEAQNPRPPGAEGLVILRGETMARLASILSVGMRSPVTDETGLTGHYDLELDIRPHQSGSNEPADLSAAIVSALQAQLGLRLVTKAGSIETLVVDHAERVPTGN